MESSNKRPRIIKLNRDNRGGIMTDIYSIEHYQIPEYKQAIKETTSIEVKLRLQTIIDSMEKLVKENKKWNYLPKRF